MRYSTILALAGYGSLSLAFIRPTDFEAKDCPADAKHTLEILASDALEITEVVNSLLDLVGKEDVTRSSTTLTSGSTAANVRELITRWFGKAALPENGPEYSSPPIDGSPYLQRVYKSMHGILQINDSKPFWLANPTFRCTFKHEMCVLPPHINASYVDGIHNMTISKESTAAFVPWDPMNEVDICPAAVYQYNQTWEQTTTMLRTEVPDYYTWFQNIGARRIMHELVHIHGVSMLKVILDQIAGNVIGRYKLGQNVAETNQLLYGPAADQWLTAYAPDLAMYNGDNYAGFALDLAFLSEGHMPPP